MHIPIPSLWQKVCNNGKSIQIGIYDDLRLLACHILLISLHRKDEIILTEVEFNVIRYQCQIKQDLWWDIIDSHRTLYIIKCYHLQSHTEVQWSHSSFVLTLSLSCTRASPWSTTPTIFFKPSNKPIWIENRRKK